MSDFRFGKRHRLRLDRDVERVLSEGRRVSGRWLTVTCLARSNGDAAKSSARTTVPEPCEGAARLAIRIPRKAGTAVARNRVKRILRETFRLERGHLKRGLDLVALVKPTNMKSIAADDIRKEWRALSEKAGAWNTNEFHD